MKNLETLKITIENHIAFLTLNRPEKANCVTEKMFEELAEVIQELDETPQARVILIHGEGKHFCAGIDLSFLTSFMGETASINDPAKKSEYFYRLLQKKLQLPFLALGRCSKPIISAVHGAAVGAGFALFSGADLRYSTKDAHLAMPEINLGIVADIGPIQSLIKDIPYNKLFELVATGKSFTGEEAYQWGISNGIYDTKEEVMENAINMAKEIASKSPILMKGIKREMLYSRDHSFEDSMHHIAETNAIRFQTTDLSKIFEAKMLKQLPIFED